MSDGKNITMVGFGMVRIKKSGCAIHPDEIYSELSSELSDEEYITQLLKYEEQTGDEYSRIGCVRDYLVDSLISGTDYD